MISIVSSTLLQHYRNFSVVMKHFGSSIFFYLLRLRVGVLYFAAAVSVSACGGGGEVLPAIANRVTGVNAQPGVTPFISSVKLSGQDLESVTTIRYTIARKPGSVSKPVKVQYSIGALKQRGYTTPIGNSITLPVFGLYAGYLNHVVIELSFVDTSTQILAIDIATASYSDPNQIYDKPTILQGRAPAATLGFDFIYLKSQFGTPIVVDTDAQIRWVGPNIGYVSSASQAFIGSSFFIGDSSSKSFTRLELDGVTHPLQILSSTVTAFHHNIGPGKVGLIAEVNTGSSGIESTAIEIDKSGKVLSQWDLAALLSSYMRSQGDDPALFVRPGVDWFHMNSTVYDQRDDSLIVSSRENFVIKIDYKTGSIKWIFGDPTKHWYTFPSLRAKALQLDSGGLYPIGQHALSINSAGQLELFNDGEGSLNQPAGASPGGSRTYSVVSAYTIDPIAKMAHEAWRFDYGQKIFSAVCSSAYEAGGKTLLVDYAYADGGTHSRLVGLDTGHNVVFDFQYSSTYCGTSWNAQPIRLENLIIQ